MRGEPEPHYARVNKRPRDYDRAGDDNRSVGSHHSRHSERERRGDDYRRTPKRADELHVSTTCNFTTQTPLTTENFVVGFIAN